MPRPPRRAAPSSADRAVALLWRPRAAGTRGPRPALSLDRIVEIAIALADRDGLAELSMERIARELDVTPMALYRYVAGKADLIALMIDRGLGAPPVPRGDDWRAALLGWATAMHAVLQRHPWSLEATGRLRVMGPCELGWLEAGMRALAGTSLTPAERREACLALVSQIRTSVQFGAPGPDGLTPARWAAATRRVLAEREDFPELTAALRDRGEPRRLADTLAWVLDGIAARIAGR